MLHSQAGTSQPSTQIFLFSVLRSVYWCWQCVFCSICFRYSWPKQQYSLLSKFYSTITHSLSPGTWALNIMRLDFLTIMLTFLISTKSRLIKTLWLSYFISYPMNKTALFQRLHLVNLLMRLLFTTKMLRLFKKFIFQFYIFRAKQCIWIQYFFLFEYSFVVEVFQKLISKKWDVDGITG